VILANEARMVRLNALAKRTLVIDHSIAIFRVFPPSENKCVVLVSEERDRLMAARQQAQAALSLAFGQYIRALFPDGTLPVYRVDTPKVPPDRNPLSGLMRTLYA
jgi:hypothetical protein